MKLCTFQSLYPLCQMHAFLLNPLLHPFAPHPKISQGWKREASQLTPALTITDPQTWQKEQQRALAGSDSGHEEVSGRSVQCCATVAFGRFDQKWQRPSAREVFTLVHQSLLHHLVSGQKYRALPAQVQCHNRSVGFAELWKKCFYSVKIMLNSLFCRKAHAFPRQRFLFLICSSPQQSLLKGVFC